MSTAALQFGQQLVDTLLPSTLATGSQLVLSPLLVWFALLLLLNGAGNARCLCAVAGAPSKPPGPHTHEILIALALAGPSTPTYNEILSVVTGGSAAFGGSSLADINTQVAALRAALSRQSAGNNTLTMTDAVWARDIAVNPAFAGDMQRVFKVGGAQLLRCSNRGSKQLGRMHVNTCQVAVCPSAPILCSDCCPQAKVASVPDAAPINEWVANVTNNLIKQAVPPGLAFDMVSCCVAAAMLICNSKQQHSLLNCALDGFDITLCTTRHALAALQVLTNAIYFKGLWQHPFDKRLTADRPFSVITAGNPNTPQADIMVPTMLQSFGPPSANVSFSEAPGKYKAVRLPYLDSTGLAAVFVLPDASSSSIADAAGAITGESMLDPGTWGPLTDNLDVYLPRFKVEAQLKLTQVSSHTMLPVVQADTVWSELLGEASGCVGCQPIIARCTAALCGLCMPQHRQLCARRAVVQQQAAMSTAAAALPVCCCDVCTRTPVGRPYS